MQHRNTLIGRISLSRFSTRVHVLPGELVEDLIRDARDLVVAALEDFGVACVLAAVWRRWDRGRSEPWTRGVAR